MATGNQTTRLVIQLGDGASPETFGATCGGNAFGVTLINNLGETTALDCTDPLDIPAVVVRHLESQDTSITIAGTVTTEAWPTWRGWSDDAFVKNIRVFLDESAANNGGYWTLPAYCQQIELNKEASGKVFFTANISAAGRRVWTDAT